MGVCENGVPPIPTDDNHLLQLEVPTVITWLLDMWHAYVLFNVQYPPYALQLI